jgi:hypothetical protein
MGRFRPRLRRLRTFDLLVFSSANVSRGRMRKVQVTSSSF